MFTTGSKLLIGSTVVAVIAAIAYGVTQEGPLGTIGLAAAALALGALAAANIYTRDANVFLDDPYPVETTAAAQQAPRPVVWPLGLAVGAVIVGVGLITHQAVFIVGLIVLLGAGAEWTTTAWAERASADRALNDEVRARVANPLEFPLAGALAIAVIIFSFSRVMLWLSKTNTVIAFGVFGVVLLAFAFFFAYNPRVKSRAVVSVVAVGALGVIAAGAAAGADGPREINEHETTEELAPEGVCDDPEETEGDEKASQRVAATAAVAATVTLNSDETLTVAVNGPAPEGATALDLPRSNPSNILFRNNTTEPRRLSFDLGSEEVELDDGEVEEIAVQLCTSLVEEGGVQNITVTIAQPSFAFADGYRMFVPGVDGAEIELVVP
jgi:hypothetical protein